MSWVLDLDGVVWRGGQPIEGSSHAIDRLREAGRRVLYVTNNAWLTTDGYVAKLASFGIPAARNDIVHAGHAVASLIKPGEDVLLCAGRGVAEAIGQRANVIDVSVVASTPQVDVVVIGIRDHYEYQWLNHAARAVLAGARLVAPSADPLYPVPDGFQMGGGAAVAAVTYATGVEAQIAGKPFEPMVDAVVERLAGEPTDVLVGDQTGIDGSLAMSIGCRFALVRSGVSGNAHPRTETPLVAVDHVADNLSAVVSHYLPTHS